MKTTVLFIFLFVSSFINAQFYEDWTEPLAITDSISINTNPDVLADTDILDGDVVVFYEKTMSVESNSQIWMRNLTTLEEEQEILAIENIDFRNPKLLVFSPYYDTRCFIIYESNEAGNFDIYGIEFFEDGSFGSSFQLTNTPEDENSCYISSLDADITACWETNSNIYFSEISFSQDTLQFEEIVTIDTNYCMEPICSDDHVFYRKMVGDSAHIYFSKNIATGVWTQPAALYAIGNNINLQMIKHMFYSTMDGEYIIWENNGQAQVWTYWSQEVSTVQFQGAEICYEPSCLTYDVITDFWMPAIYTFCSGNNENREVYAINEEFSYVVINISNNSNIDRYPKLFMGKMAYNYFNTLNIWQSELNDNSVLYLSQVSVLIGGTTKYKKNKLDLQISPNPFKDHLEIGFNSKEKGIVCIEIVSITGKKLFEKKINVNANYIHSFTWNPQKDGINLSRGIYFVKLKLGESSIVRKVVYAK